MVFENGVKNIQAAAYNGARTVNQNLIKFRIIYINLRQRKGIFCVEHYDLATVCEILARFRPILDFELK
jgi:hypothetical protein